jgi:hypothetical protein
MIQALAKSITHPARSIIRRRGVERDFVFVLKAV